MRKPIVAGNWKMNTTLAEAKTLVEGVVAQCGSINDADVVVCPPFISMSSVHDVVAGSSVALGAQNMSQHSSGAYTGEVSSSMLISVGARYVILGHSERRQYFGETDASVAEKAQVALEAGLTPIVCVGETLDERKAGQENAVVEAQLRGSLAGITADTLSGKDLVIAYEPVWAIGTGEVATPDQAQAMHRSIRAVLSTLLGDAVAQRTRLQYGGSVKPGNAAELFQMPDIDGALVGGASLKADDFAAIINSVFVTEG